ncbi:hypothetical protein Bhyg_07830 [Pseudolycoriella hygida]|uniref:THAP-type domain-containing protein n=1 Tax=Pseudolycoriella hygida TaxID=35572 RepID=A0A9Q0N3G1_9DIPT|nr:hypothetical protein Bhyg_07830 [Pseudolycoriella hygida]
MRVYCFVPVTFDKGRRQRKLWMKRTKTECLNPTRNNKICRRHFLQSELVVEANGKKLPSPNAVPSLYLPEHPTTTSDHTYHLVLYGQKAIYKELITLLRKYDYVGQFLKNILLSFSSSSSITTFSTSSPKKRRFKRLPQTPQIHSQVNLEDQACKTYPELRKSLNVRSTTGRPRLEDDQPSLTWLCMDQPLMNAVETKQLERAMYLRSLPSKSKSIEGKRHVKTVPVKLIRPSNDSHKHHVDSKFAMTTINHLDELASLLGPEEVTFISQDDKAKIPVGLPAVAKQAPLLMHMEYRSSKHSSSTAMSHARE